MTVSYSYMNGVPISQTRDGVTHSFMLDGDGSLVALIDESGDITDTFQWWPFGELMSRTGTTDVDFGWMASKGLMKGSSGQLLSPRGMAYDPRNANFLQSQKKDKPIIPELPQPYRDCIWTTLGNYAWPDCPLKGYDKKDANDKRRCWAEVIRCIIWCESGDDPNKVNDSTDATGLMQIIPDHEGKKGIACCVKDPKTGKYSLGKCDITNRKDPCQNIGIGTLLLWSCLQKGYSLSECNSTHGGFSVVDNPCFTKCVDNYQWPK